ncbi:hypothetical protein KFK09_020534 [Dendrobium nobile]|uniref:Uncharacterized protein n=1 Tax=Dendrobium nobile TaxID=94219 RepID=A0A8T3AMT3_DENNO|nr:hypothetical protein KFK09_020534 [Dendrobium nobile]
MIFPLSRFSNKTSNVYGKFFYFLCICTEFLYKTKTINSLFCHKYLATKFTA